MSTDRTVQAATIVSAMALTTQPLGRTFVSAAHACGITDEWVSTVGARVDAGDGLAVALTDVGVDPADAARIGLVLVVPGHAQRLVTQLRTEAVLTKVVARLPAVVRVVVAVAALMAVLLVVACLHTGALVGFVGAALVAGIAGVGAKLLFTQRTVVNTWLHRDVTIRRLLAVLRTSGGSLNTTVLPISVADGALVVDGVRWDVVVATATADPVLAGLVSTAPVTSGQRATWRHAAQLYERNAMTAAVRAGLLVAGWVVATLTTVVVCALFM